MIVLATESSTALGSVALIKDNKVLASESSMQQRAHSEFLNPAIAKCLKTAGLTFQQIDLFATSTGPGSFTGIRVAGNIIKSLAYSFEKPIFVMDSLELLALSELGKFENILCIINAYKNMVYFSVYSKSERTQGPAVVRVADLESVLTDLSGTILCVGDGYRAYENVFTDHLKSKLSRFDEVSDYPLAATLGLAAADRAKLNKTIEWNSFVPLYLRASEAEENLRK